VLILELEFVTDAALSYSSSIEGAMVDIGFLPSSPWQAHGPQRDTSDEKVFKRILIMVCARTTNMVTLVESASTNEMPNGTMSSHARSILLIELFKFAFPT
jgi:hypothetical protein